MDLTGSYCQTKVKFIVLLCSQELGELIKLNNLGKEKKSYILLFLAINLQFICILTVFVGVYANACHAFKIIKSMRFNPIGCKKKISTRFVFKKTLANPKNNVFLF